MMDCKCIECEHKCYEYYNNSTSDKAYYEWTYKHDKCLQEEAMDIITAESGVMDDKH